MAVIEVKKMSAAIPVSVEALIDAGYPAPEGYEPPARPRMSWRTRVSLRWWGAVWDARISLAKWIAGDCWPEEDGW